MKKLIYVTVLAVTALTMGLSLQAKEVSKKDGDKVSMCYTHTKKWHPCAVQSSK